jgi:hypothetical protein
MQKPMSRALRRHHVARLKNVRRFFWGGDLSLEPASWSRVVQTPAQCSCWCCGNPRKWDRAESYQERKKKQNVD